MFGDERASAEEPVFGAALRLIHTCPAIRARMGIQARIPYTGQLTGTAKVEHSGPSGDFTAHLACGHCP